MTYGTSLLIDLIALLICGIALVRYGRLTHSHPATVYLFFHVYAVTWRLVGLLNGASTLFSDWGPTFFALQEDEIVRAASLADVSLVAFTVACLVVARRPEPEEKLAPLTVPTLNMKIVWTVVVIAMPFGIFGQMMYSIVPSTILDPSMTPTLDVGDWRGSSYLAILQAWPGLLLLMLIYCYGFRRWLVIPMVLYLAIMSIQGYHRFRVIVPIILLVQIYLDRRHRKWPGIGGVALLLALAMVFFPLKVIGKMVQDRESASHIVDAATEIVTDAGKGQAGDQQFLDQFACSLTMVDNTGSFYYGKPYAALLTLPVPRKWWPEKPGLADHIIDFSRPWRPMNEAGMILTYMGESYANFGYPGVVIIAFGLGYGLTRAYRAAYRRSYASIFRFAFLMLACNFIQVFRDGLVSIIMFTTVNMMPLAIVVLLHKWFAEFRERDGMIAESSETQGERVAAPKLDRPS